MFVHVGPGFGLAVGFLGPQDIGCRFLLIAQSIYFRVRFATSSVHGRAAARSPMHSSGQHGCLSSTRQEFFRDQGS